METFSALLVLCAGNSQVTGESPAQRPVMRNFYVFFDLRLNKRLSKQSRGWWFETPLRALWRHCNCVSVNLYFQAHMHNRVNLLYFSGNFRQCTTTESTYCVNEFQGIYCKQNYHVVSQWYVNMLSCAVVIGIVKHDVNSSGIVEPNLGTQCGVRVRMVRFPLESQLPCVPYPLMWETSGNINVTGFNSTYWMSPFNSIHCFSMV